MNVVAKIFPTWKTKKLKVNAKSGAISYDKWLVKFKENQVFNAKLQFTVGSRKKKLTVYSKNSMAAITGLQATTFIFFTAVRFILLISVYPSWLTSFILTLVDGFFTYPST